MSRTRAVSLGGAVGLLVLALVSWFVLLSPRLAKAEEVRAETDSVLGATAAMRAQIAQLTQVRDSLPDLLAELERLSTMFPREAEIPAVLEGLRAVAAESSVRVEALQADAPVAVTAGAVALEPGAAGTTAPAEPGAQAPADAAGTAGGATADGSAAAEGSAAGNGQPLARMQVSMTVAGSYEGLTAFLLGLEDAPRAYLLDTAAVSAGGTTAEELMLTVTGTMFVVEPPVYGEAEDADAEGQATEEQATGGDAAGSQAP